MQLVHGLVSQLRKDEGRVVVIGAPDTPLVTYVFKTACNGALRGFCRALRVDLAGQGVSVSLVAPAGTRGGMVINLPSMIDNNRAGRSEEMNDLYGVPSIYHQAKKGDVGFDPAWAVDAIEHAVTSKCPKATYTTTPLGTLIYVMVWFQSEKCLEKIIRGKLGAPLPDMKKWRAKWCSNKQEVETRNI